MARASKLLSHRCSIIAKKLCFAFVLVFGAAIVCGFPATAAEDEGYRTADGLAVYVGVVRAEIVKGPSLQPSVAPMHGGIPKGTHEYHVVAAIFDAATKERISDATVTARVSGLALVGHQKTLEPMIIANTTTYGGFFDLPDSDLYTISLTIQRTGSPRPAVLDFKFDHRLGN